MIMGEQNQVFRIGHGYDVHRFKEGDNITLGGIKIPHTRGFEAHSDGDVLLHAACDALLGAIAAGDIGQHFPDTDPAYAGIASTVLLAKVYQRVVDAGYRLGNLDATVIAQSPKLAPFTHSMRESVAAVLDSNVDQINIKATTNEKLGYIGREEGIAVHCVVILAAR
jgi:2-C-methyl-D-erythritol 2,4-cyclodiphosphate synthase